MATHREETVLGFMCEWFDPQPQLVRRYKLHFHVNAHQVEMKDMKSGRTFLRKSPAPDTLSMNDMVLGARINIYGRMLTLVEFADPKTASLLSSTQARTCVVVADGLVDQIGQVVAFCEGLNLKLCKLRMVVLQGGELDVPVSGRTVLMELSGGSGDTAASLEAAFLERFGAGAYAVDSLPEASGPSTAVATEDSTCAVILPHVVKRGGAGAVLTDLLEAGFELTGLGMFALKKEDAANFLEVYQGVVPEYSEHVDELYSGPCLALALRAGADAVPALREVVGPWDVEIAKEIRPKSVRAKHGADKVRKAVHVTDLPEDGAREVGFFFGMLWQEGGLA